jgi:predicted nucleic acid-binding protein
MVAVTNTSPVILLARIGRLSLLRELYGSALMPPFVKTECIDRGREAGAVDVPEIESGIAEGWIQLATLDKGEMREAARLSTDARIGRGEAEALVLAKRSRALVVLDDKEARAIAKGRSLEHTSTVMVLFEAFKAKVISYDELVDDLAKLTSIMWISTDVIAEIIRRAKEVRR